MGNAQWTRFFAGVNIMAATGLQCTWGVEAGDNPLSQAHSAHWLGEHEKWQLANSIATLHTFLSPLFLYLSLHNLCVVLAQLAIMRWGGIAEQLGGNLWAGQQAGEEISG